MAGSIPTLGKHSAPIYLIFNKGFGNPFALTLHMVVGLPAIPDGVKKAKIARA
jgi:hypothetical protein